MALTANTSTVAPVSPAPPWGPTSTPAHGLPEVKEDKEGQVVFLMTQIQPPAFVTGSGERAPLSTGS